MLLNKVKLMLNLPSKKVLLMLLQAKNKSKIHNQQVQMILQVNQFLDNKLLWMRSLPPNHQLLVPCHARKKKKIPKKTPQDSSSKTTAKQSLDDAQSSTEEGGLDGTSGQKQEKKAELIGRADDARSSNLSTTFY